MKRWNLALLLLPFALIPLLYVSLWFGIAMAAVLYVLLARLASNDLDRPSQMRKNALHNLREH
jgi:hypothetical protein